MKKHIEQTEIIALFFRSYFLYTRIAFKKHRTEEENGKINGYRTLLRILGEYSKSKHILGNDVLTVLRSYVVRSENPYRNGFINVFEELTRFIYDHVLTEETITFQKYA